MDIVAAGSAHRNTLRQLFELYAHDFSPMTGAELDAHGRYTPDDFLSGRWKHGDGDFHPFILMHDGHPAGFAYVLRGGYIDPAIDDHWLMDEFFVIRKHRRAGLGARFARALFARFPGIWEIGEIHANTEAIAFWRAVLRKHTGGRFDEAVVDNPRWTGVVQRFTQG
jgi:predicted acetyltransferase